MTEDRGTRLKRLRIRCWRRGTKEMDLLLGGFADGGMTALDAAGLDQFERLLEENDQDLYTWISGQIAAPEVHRDMLERLRMFHKIG